MIYLILLNLFISLILLKFFYIIFKEKIFYPFRVAEIYAYFFSNTILFVLNFLFYSIFLSMIFIIFNTLIFYIFYHLVNMIQTSPRTKILIDLLKFKKINIDKYYESYNLEVIIKNRLERFESSNQVNIVNNKIYYSNHKSNFLKLLSFIFTLIKKI